MTTFQIQASPLPSDFRGTPQELFEAILDRLEVSSDIVTIVESETMPTSNQGPWLKNGNQWWVWDAGSSTYVPIDISASAQNEIYIGETAPDPEEFQLWLQTDGVTVTNFFYYAGSTNGWIAKAAELQPGAVTETIIADGAVSTAKLKNLSVTAAKLQNDLPISKFERGLAYQIMRMDGTAASAVWSEPWVESSEQSFVTEGDGAYQIISFTHDLPRTPRFVRCVYRCKVVEHGYSVGDEMDALGCNNDGASNGRVPVLMANATVAKLLIRGKQYFRPLDDPSTNFAPNPANWKIVFYCSH